MVKKWGLLLITLMTSAAFAYPNCKAVAALQRGFNMNDYEHCRQLLQQCPKSGVMADKNCVNQIARRQHSCYQLKQFAREVNGSIFYLTAEKIDNFVLVNHTFIADGQNNYYIISPTGCFVNTIVDLKKLDKNLRQKYKNTALMIMNDKKPQVESLPNNGKRFKAFLKVTKDCLACEVQGYAVVDFDFNAKGKLVKTKIASFNK